MINMIIMVVNPQDMPSREALIYLLLRACQAYVAKSKSRPAHLMEYLAVPRNSDIDVPVDI